jgi:hypothetical protein
MTMAQYVALHSTTYPQLNSLLAQTVEADASRAARELERSEFGYTKHLSEAELKRGLEGGKLKSGKFTVNRDYWVEGTVAVREFDQFVLIPGLEAMNRAVDGDIVAIEILPQSEWKAPSHRSRQPPSSHTHAAGSCLCVGWLYLCVQTAG